MPHTPAYPITEMTRHVTSPGITIHELYTAQFIAAHISRHGAIDTDQRAIDKCKLLADLALSHRRQS